MMMLLHSENQQMICMPRREKIKAIIWRERAHYQFENRLTLETMMHTSIGSMQEVIYQYIQIALCYSLEDRSDTSLYQARKL